jgi:beta-lactamase regulating signal transducer with metallopeptidase domain
MLVWCAETAIVTAILSLVVLAVSRFRSVTPSVKHALWLVVLVKFATPPFLCWPWAVDWRSLEWTPSWRTTAESDVSAQERVTAASADSPLTDLPPPDSLSRGEPDTEQRDGSPEARRIAAASGGPTAAAADLTPAPPLFATVPTVAPEGRAVSWRRSLPSAAPIMRGVLIVWLVVSVAIAIAQAIRIVRFRRRLRSAIPAPDFLIDEACRIGHLLGVSVPEVLVVDNLGTPMLWCLARPQLLLPTNLVRTLAVASWRGILTHELAHLRRRDHWVARLELATGLIWWWNPLYWLTRSRIDAEAELACDAWVVWAQPKDRLTYAEALFDICSNLSQAKPIASMLGVAGSGRFFERRLMMILHNCAPCRLSLLGLAAACLLHVAAVPSWSTAKLVDLDPEDTPIAAAAGLPAVDALACSADDDDKDDKTLKPAADDDDADDADDEDDDDDDDDDDDQAEAALSRAKAQAAAAQARVEAIERKIEAARGRKQEKPKHKAKPTKGAKPGSRLDPDVDLSGLEKNLESKLGEGSEFAKHMEKLGKELESKLGSGSEFEKKMEKLGETIGKKMESKFGPGSDFEKKMQKLGKELESKFGEGSEFAEKMKALGKEMESKFGPGSEFEQKMKKLGEELKEKHHAGADVAKHLQEKAGSSADAASKAHSAKDLQRQRRIKELEARVAELIEQIKELKSRTD